MKILLITASLALLFVYSCGGGLSAVRIETNKFRAKSEMPKEKQNRMVVCNYVS